MLYRSINYIQAARGETTLIYLDNAATTRMHPAVREAMTPFLDMEFGNPSSVHSAGRSVRKAVERAREQVAQAIGADPAEIVFTSGGTEADNAAVIGIALANRQSGNHIVTTAIEHHAVLGACEFLEKIGFSVTYVPPGADGIVSPESVLAAIRSDTVLVSVMHVNNETGAIQPIEQIAAGCAERGVPFHTDGVQAVGLRPIDVKQSGIQLLSLSAHKLHGPKGVGALYVQRNTKWIPLLYGGSQERKKRAGTENVPGIIGFGAAIERMKEGQAENVRRIAQLRDTMLAMLKERVQDLAVNSPENSLPSILSVSFPGASAESMLMNLDMRGIAASSGSACTAGALQPSHVLTAMGLPAEVVKSVVRFSFSEDNSLADIETAASVTAELASQLRRTRK